MPAFELGSVHYDHYVVNIRLPSHKGFNKDFGRLVSLNIVVSKHFTNQLTRGMRGATCGGCIAAQLHIM